MYLLGGARSNADVPDTTARMNAAANPKQTKSSGDDFSGPVDLVIRNDWQTLDEGEPPILFQILFFKILRIGHISLQLIAMSALPPIADMCSATRHVRFVPIADI